MMGMRRHRAFTLKGRVASYAHPVGLVPELQRSEVRARFVAVRIMAGSTAHLSFAEALRALERLHNECRLTKSAVFVKALTRKISKRNPRVFGEEPAGRQIVQFTGGARGANRRLHMALRANANKV